MSEVNGLKENEEMDNYNKAYKEVDTILSYMPEENENQVLLPETMAILANLFRDFWATPEQRAMILQSEKEEASKIEASKKQYDAKNMFSRLERENAEAHKNLSGAVHEEVSDKAETISQTSTTIESSSIDEKALPIEKKVGFFQSIINWFKGLFGKKS